MRHLFPYGGFLALSSLQATVDYFARETDCKQSIIYFLSLQKDLRRSCQPDQHQSHREVKYIPHDHEKIRCSIRTALNERIVKLNNSQHMEAHDLKNLERNDVNNRTLRIVINNI